MKMASADLTADVSTSSGRVVGFRVTRREGTVSVTTIQPISVSSYAEDVATGDLVFDTLRTSLRKLAES